MNGPSLASQTFRSAGLAEGVSTFAAMVGTLLLSLAYDMS